MFIILNNGLVESQGMSGSDRRALTWSLLFQKHHAISIITSQHGFLRYQNKGFDKDQIFLTGTKKEHVLFFYLKQVIRACKRLNQFSNPNVIYSSSDTIADALPALYKKLKTPKAKWIAGCHLIWPHPYKVFVDPRFKKFSLLTTVYFYTTQRFLFWCFKRWANIVLVSNHRDQQYLENLGISKSKILVTPGAIDQAHIGQSSLSMKKFDACFIGRNHPQKGILDVFEIWQKVVQKRPAAKLAFVSDFPRERFDKLCKKYNVTNNISHLGFIDGPAKFEVLRASRLLMFPSYHESFGMVILEALAVGIPVISYHLPELDGFYDEEVIRVKMGNRDQFSAQVLYLLENEHLRSNLGLKAIQKAQNFTWNSTANQILKTL